MENAFSFSHTVMTVSFHKFEVGFYPGKSGCALIPTSCMHVSLPLPGTGSVDSIGQGRGTFYSVNVPLKDGITDQAFTQLFAR